MLLNLLDCTKRSVGPCAQAETPCATGSKLHVSTTLPSEEHPTLYPTCSQDLSPPLLSGAIVGPLTSSPVYPPSLQTCPFEAGSSNWWFQRFLFQATLLGSCLHAEPTDEVVRAAAPLHLILNLDNSRGGGKCWIAVVGKKHNSGQTHWCHCMCKSVFSKFLLMIKFATRTRSLLCMGSGHRETQSSFLILCWLITLDDWLRSLFLIPLLWLILINSPDLWNAMGMNLWQ